MVELPSQPDKPVAAAAPQPAKVETARNTPDVETANNAAAAKNPEMLTVKAIATFGIPGADEGHKTPDSEPYEVPKNRALDLHRLGLVEFVDSAAGDEAFGEDAKAKALSARRRAVGVRAEDKTTPLEQHPLKVKTA